MGLINKIRGFFNSSNNTPVVQEDRYAKSRLVAEIVDLAGKINRINCFDTSIRGLTNSSSYNELERKSMEELEKLQDNLSNKYAGLVRQRKQNNKNEAAIAAKWTGQRTPNMTEHDLDSYQRGD